MSGKRLAIPLCAVFSLLAIAGLLELFVLVFASSSEAVASEGMASLASQPIVGQVKSAVFVEQRAEKARQTELVVPARSLVEMASIAVDGAPLDQAGAEALVKAAGSFSSKVDYIDQKAVLPSGCEIVALAVALGAEGVEASPVDIAGFLRTGTNVATDYLGDPARNGGGLPPSIVDAANAWAEARGAGVRALDLTGTTFDGVIALARLGYPVLTWTTERLAEPRFTGSATDGLQWYRPEHCVVVYGVEGDEVLVSDSLEGLVRRDLAQFSHIYEACGNKAVLLAG